MGIDLATWRARIGLNYHHMCRPLQTRWRSSGGRLYQPGVASWGVGEVMNDTSLVLKGCMTVVALLLILQYVVCSWSKLKARGGGGKVRCQWWRTTFQVRRTLDGGGTLLLRAIVVVLPLLLVIAGDVETNPGPEEPTLKELLNELHPVQANWFNIGLELGISHVKLNSFKQMYTNPLELMREMLIHWLDEAVDPRPTWEAVVKALRSPIVEMRHVAEQLESKYCAPVHYMREESNSSSRMEECEVVHDQTTASSSEERLKRQSRFSESSTTSEARHSDRTTSPTPSEGSEKPPFGCGCGKCTFLGFIENGCPTPIPSASSFPYLNLGGLTHEQQQELKGRLRSESQEIMMRFQKLVSATIKSIQKQCVPLDELVSHVMTLGAFEPVFKESKVPLFQYRFKELKSAESIPKVFLVLNDYFSFFNYHIIEHIIEELGTEEDKQRLQTYKEDFSQYAKRRIFECQPEFGPVSDAGHADIFVKLDPKCENYTIAEIEVFRHKLSEILRVSSQGVLRLCRVVEGCFQLTFQVPSFVQQEIFPLSTEQEMFLETECVIELTCGEYQFLDNKDLLEKSMQEIDTSADEVVAFPPVQKKLKLNTDAKPEVHEVEAFPPVQKKLKLDADAKPEVHEVEAFPPVQKKLNLDADAKPEINKVEAFPPVQKKLKLDTDAKPEYLMKLHTVEGEDINLTKYGGYLRKLYDTEQHLVGIGQKFLPFKLARIEKGTIYEKDMDEFTGQTLRGDMDDVGTYRTEFYKKSPIEVEEVGKLSSHQQLTLILIEGAPGVGKTTFSWDICRKWSRGEILQEHSLLLLLPLRDNKLKEAKTLSDLFYHPNSKLQQAVVQEVISNQGQGVAIWLEAWDELDYEPRKEASVFLDLIHGRILPCATVFITSRPWATKLLRDEYGPHITQHVEILTSAKDQIEHYISKAEAEAQPSSFAAKFTDYLSSNPVIRAAMYTPVTANMAAEVFTWSQHTESPPPTTMTELLTAFTLKTLTDHLSAHPVYHKQLKVTTFSDLPKDVYKQFQGLCKIAFEGILNRQQLVFSAAHLPTEFVSLGLMKEVHQLYTESGTSSYHFIHLTLQEYLAAVHISQLPAHEQVRLFQEHLDSGYFKLTIKFWAGLTKLANMPPDVTKSLMESDETKLTCFHFLFEAKNILVITESLGLDEIVFKPQYSWTPLDYYVTGYAVSHSNCLWRLYFSSSSIDDEKFELFCKGCAAPWGIGCRGHIVHANFSENNITSNSIQSFVNVPSCIIQKMKELELHHNKLDGSACDLLAKSISSMSSLRKLCLNNNSIESGGAVKVIKALCDSEVKQLWLNDTGIGVPDCEALCELLKPNCSLEELRIYGNNLSSESVASIITGLGHNSSLTKLNISNSLFSMANVNSLASVLKYHSKCTLTKLKLRDCRISSKNVVELATGLCKNTTLKHLDLSHNPIGAQVKGVTAVAEMLAEVHGSHSNFTLTELELRECHISGQGATELAAALCKNSTLKYLNLNYNAVGVEGASSISDMLQHNKSLEVLNLRSESVGEEGVHQLINSLKHNKTLKKLCLPNNYKPENSDRRIEWY